jgi:hypothetical protein
VRGLPVYPPNHGAYGLMSSTLAKKRGESLSCDLIGPLPRSKGGSEHALVLVDDFTKNTEVFPLRKATTKAVLERVIDYCFRNGFPKNIRSDNGPQFSSSQWNDVCRALRINPKKVVPYRPQGNPTERVNRTLKQCIKAYASNHRDWDEHLTAIAFGIRTAVSETTGFTPSMLTFGEELTSPFDPPVLEDVENTQAPDVLYPAHIEKLKGKMSNIVETARKNCERARGNQEQY